MAAASKKVAKRVPRTPQDQVEHVGLDGHVHEGPEGLCGLCEALNEPMVDAEPEESEESSLRPAEEFVPREAPPEPKLPKPVKHVLETFYPDGTKLFWYHPRDEKAEPIPLPTVVFNAPDKVFFFELHQVRKNPFTQMYMWMDRFEIPTNLQRHIVNTVDDKEFFEMCDKWMESIGGGATSGE